MVLCARVCVCDVERGENRKGSYACRVGHLGMIQACWLKKVTALHEHLVAQMNQLLIDI